MGKKRMAKEEGGRWEVEGLRATVFLGGEPFDVASAENWWELLSGSKPDKRVSSPSRSSLQDLGPLGDRVLVLNVTPLRIDWILQPKQSKESTPFSLGDIAALPFFVDFIDKWISKHCPPAVRLALGVELHVIADSVIGANRLFRKYVSAVNIPDEATDLGFSVNLPTQESIAGRVQLINRLMQWNVLQLVMGQIEFQLGSSVASTSNESFPVLNLRLDINTDAENRKPIGRRELCKLLERFAEIATRISAKGDSV
ncbi:MAG: hypothetical protein L0211_04800 [Planctomycetaceae bacterium]|nr:hypothetical protein [Planctomycetaceae bacterium]